MLIANEEELNNLSPLFKMYKDIDDIYSLLIDAMNNKQYRLEKKDQNVILTLDFYILKEKKVNISFNLKEQQIKKEDYSVEKLYSLIQKLFEENKSIKEEFTNQTKELQNRINGLEKEINKKNKEIVDIKKELKELKNEFHRKRIIDNYFNTSKIIKLKEEKSKLISWISEKGIIKEIKLLYSSKRDGDEYSPFYNKCSNISPTLSLIKTKKERKFGGFTFGKWNDKQGILKQTDSEAFLFSLNNMKKYKILKPNLAIASYSDHSSFLTYGNNGDGCGIYLKNNFLTNGGHENHTSKAYDTDSQYCLSTEENFSVEEVEVYNIILNK
jgi:DNA gyrase/topoisomerase IV subunit A